MMKKLLIAETDRIGDVVLSLPVFKSIKRHHPGIRITALIREYTRDLFRYFPYADHVIAFSGLEKKEERERVSSDLAEGGFDTALILHPEYRVARIIRDAKIKNRFSFGWKWYQFLFTRALIQHRSKNTKHQLEYNLESLKMLHIPRGTADIRLKPGPKELQFIHDLLKKRRLKGRRFIAIHPGSGHSSLNFPPEGYVRLIEKIHRSFKRADIFLTGQEKEKSLIEYIMCNTRVPLHPMPLNLSLGHLIAFLSCAKVFITNSTGPMHIASALRVPVAAFFSPVFIHSPVRWGPYWGRRLVVTPDVKCEKKWKCPGRRCGLYNCFDRVDLNKVLDFIRSSLS